MSLPWVFKTLWNQDIQNKNNVPYIFVSSQRAKSVTQEVIDNYLRNLTNIFTKYNFDSMPQNISNIEETDLSHEHKRPKVLKIKGMLVQFNTKCI
jgi:hypothetical protein